MTGDSIQSTNSLVNNDMSTIKTHRNNSEIKHQLAFFSFCSILVNLSYVETAWIKVAKSSEYTREI